jgi:hypothetical protein
MVEKQLSPQLKTFRSCLPQYSRPSEVGILDQSQQGDNNLTKRRKTMKRAAITLAAVTFLVLAAVSSLPGGAAQTRNQNSKFQITEFLTFPNDCTNELMDVFDTTTVNCHDQQRADGQFSEKCEIRQDVTATGETSGITWHGTATFKDEFVATDDCNFSFSNRGRVPLISSDSNVNTIITFDDFVRMDNCVLTSDQHVVSSDCLGAGKP